MRSALLCASLVCSATALGCECPSPVEAFEDARSIVLVRVIELHQPSLNAGAENSPERAARIEGRAVVLEALYGDRPEAIEFQIELDQGMCSVMPPRFGEVLVVPLLEPGETLAIGHCTTLLTLGEEWDGWDGPALKLRDALKHRDWSSRATSDVIYDHFRWPVPPPPPPSANEQRIDTARPSLKPGRRCARDHGDAK